MPPGATARLLGGQPGRDTGRGTDRPTSSTMWRAFFVLRLATHHAPFSKKIEPEIRLIPRSLESRQIVQP